MTFTISEKQNTAPVALFVYNRPEHTRRTIKALAENEGAKNTVLHIFSDAARSDIDKPSVQAVREYIRHIDGFQQVIIVEQKINLGLAKSIIDGVTRLCDEFERVIVLEDDILTSTYFLKFMNQALDEYENVKEVWHISGWNYPIDQRGQSEAYFLRIMNCWGWATWADRWQYFNKDPKGLMGDWDKEKIEKFNLDGSHDFWSQITANASGRMNTWAIFWYATIFERKGLCLNPSNSYVENIGNDGSGQNCGSIDFFKSSLSSSIIQNFPRDVVEDKIAVEKIKYFYLKGKPRLSIRILRKIKKSLVKFWKF